MPLPISFTLQPLVTLARRVSFLHSLGEQLRFPWVPSKTIAVFGRLRKGTPHWLSKEKAGGTSRPNIDMSTPENKSYLAAGISALSPWGSRASTPRQLGFEGDELPPEASLGSQRGGDHTINRTHRQSLRNYPRDCPSLAVQWFHAIDVSTTAYIPTEATFPCM